MVEVAVAAVTVVRIGERRRSEQNGLIGIADELRSGVWLRVHGDGPNVPLHQVAVLPYGMDYPDRRFAPVDDGDSPEAADPVGRARRRTDGHPITRRIGSRSSGSAPSGKAIVS